MGEKKPEPLDFVKDFQEYLTQQTHHVNMISGSVSGDKEAETLQGGELISVLSVFLFFEKDCTVYVPDNYADDYNCIEAFLIVVFTSQKMCTYFGFNQGMFVSFYVFSGIQKAKIFGIFSQRNR